MTVISVFRGFCPAEAAVIDSLTVRQSDTISIRQLDTLASPADTISAAELDSLRLAAVYDSLDNEFWGKIDTTSLPFLDSTYRALYDSLAVDLPDTHDIKRAIRRIRKEYRDSVRENTPRIINTSAIPDSMFYRRLLTWSADSKFNEIALVEQDTSFNYHFNDYPFFKKDINATYLGIVGSATQNYNYFKRDKVEDSPMFTPYVGDSYTPENLPQFNVKKPYTELAYWGTLFAIKEMEENELNLRVSQNMSPAFNITLAYLRYGSRGMLKNEATDNRTTSLAVNYLGKKYVMNGGVIWQKIDRKENGGIQDSYWIRDTIVDTKTIEVNLANASNKMHRLTAFVDHSYTIPMNFFNKKRDSLSVGEGTTAYVGHYGEFSLYNKTYTDEIAENDTHGRDFYFNKFYFNKTYSNDVLKTNSFNNKFFIKLQPFSPDAAVSRLNAGIGYQIMSLYQFDDSYYLTGNRNTTQHNAYLYAGVNGKIKKYIAWDAYGDYYFMGYRMFDFNLKGNIRFSVYPIEKGIHLTGRFSTSLTTPHQFVKVVNMNHHQWNENLGKTSETRVEGLLEIPKWQMEAQFSYALVSNLIYYDELSHVRQNNKAMSIMSGYLMKNFKLWAFHFDNKVLFQLSSDENVLPLPKLALNLRYYVEFPVVKEVMRMQIGVNGTFNTKYYAQSYSPDLGVFYNQKKELIGNNPYCDVFINMQWKRACIFVKYTNAFKDWPESDYFSAYHYVKPVRGFKFGIFWGFR